MDICITAASAYLNSKVDEYFGRSKYYIFINPETMEFDIVPNTAANLSNAGIRASEIVLKRAPSAVLTRSIGKNAVRALRKAGIKVYKCKDTTVMEALSSFKAGTLEKIDA